jgi:hypothetical protein
LPEFLAEAGSLANSTTTGRISSAARPKLAGFNVTVTAISKKCRTFDENRIGNVQKTRKACSNH